MAIGSLFDGMIRPKVSEASVSDYSEELAHGRDLYSILLPDSLNLNGVRVKREGSITGVSREHALSQYLNRNPHQKEGRLWYSRLQKFEGFPGRFAVVVPDVEYDPRVMTLADRENARVLLFAQELMHSRGGSDEQLVSRYVPLAKRTFEKIMANRRAYLSRVSGSQL